MCDTLITGYWLTKTKSGNLKNNFLQKQKVIHASKKVCFTLHE